MSSELWPVNIDRRGSYRRGESWICCQQKYNVNCCIERRPGPQHTTAQASIAILQRRRLIAVCRPSRSFQVTFALQFSSNKKRFLSKTPLLVGAIKFVNNSIYKFITCAPIRPTLAKQILFYRRLSVCVSVRLCVCMSLSVRTKTQKTTHQKLMQLGKNICYGKWSEERLLQKRNVTCNFNFEANRQCLAQMIYLLIKIIYLDWIEIWLLYELTVTCCRYILQAWHLV